MSFRPSESHGEVRRTKPEASGEISWERRRHSRGQFRDGGHVSLERRSPVRLRGGWAGFQNALPERSHPSHCLPAAFSRVPMKSSSNNVTNGTSAARGPFPSRGAATGGAGGTCGRPATWSFTRSKIQHLRRSARSAVSPDGCPGQSSIQHLVSCVLRPASCVLRPET